MKVVIQRVSQSEVVVDHKSVGKIGKGFMLLIGIDETDEKQDAEWLAQKILNLRVFGDDEGKLNLSILDIKGEILCISQFTLIADYKRVTVLLLSKRQNRIRLFRYSSILKKKLLKAELKRKAEFLVQI